MEEAKKSGGDIGNIIAARSALLDFYGDRATSFVSLFIASIFGLVTISAIVQIMLFGMIGQVTFLAQFFEIPRLSLNVVFIIISIFVYATFVLIALYTYNRYAFYSDLADKLTRCELRSVADLGCLSLSVLVKDVDEKKRKILFHAAEKYAAELKEDDKPKAEIKVINERYHFNFAIHEKYMVDIQKEGHVKKNLVSKYFQLITCLLFLGLALLTYYPLFTLPFKVA